MIKPTIGDVAPSDERQHVAAIGLVILAVSLFSCLDATAKYLVTYSGLPIEQIVWARFAAQFFGMACIVPALGVMNTRDMFVTAAPGLQMLRSLFMALTTLFNFMAVEYLRLDQTITIMFVSPLLVALLAGPFLGEWIGWRRIASIVVGFAGVMIVVRPGLGEFNVGVLYSMSAMLALTGFVLLTKKLAGRDPAIVTLYYSMFAGVLFGAPFAFATGVWPSDTMTYVLMIATGAFGGLGHYFFILAYKHVSTSYLSPFLYLQILGMIFLGYLVFGDIPDAWSIIGASVIVLSGLYVYHRESIARRS